MLRKAIGGGDATYVIPSDYQDEVDGQEAAFELRQVQPSRSGSFLPVTAGSTGKSSGSRRFVAPGSKQDSQSQKSSRYLRDYL